MGKCVEKTHVDSGHCVNWESGKTVTKGGTLIPSQLGAISRLCPPLSEVEA